MAFTRSLRNCRADIVSAVFLCLTVALAFAYAAPGGRGPDSRSTPNTATRAANGSDPRSIPVEFKRLVTTVEAQAAGAAPGPDESKGKAALAPVAPGVAQASLEEGYELSPWPRLRALARHAYGARAPPPSA